MRKLVWMACLTYLLTGIGHIIIGSVLEPMIHRYDLDYSDGGQLIMNQFLGFLGGVLLTPFIIRSLGRRTTILLALSLFAISQFALSLLAPWQLLLFIIPFGGAGLGITEAVIAGLIIGQLKEKKASTMVLTEVFFGVGALLMPIVSAILIWRGMWHYSFAIVGTVIVIALFLWLFLRFDENEAFMKKQVVSTDSKMNKVEKPRYPKVSMPILFLGSFFFFIYVGTEMTLPNYMPSILGMTSDLSPSILALSITVFWGAMTIGRLIITFTVEQIGFAKLFIVCCTGQLITLGFFAASPHYIMSYIVIFFAGLLMGGVFSLGLLVVNESIPGLEDRTTSLLIAMGGLGGALLPRLTGSLLDNYPVQVTLWFLFGSAALMFLLMLVLFSFRKKIMPAQKEKNEKYAVN